MVSLSKIYLVIGDGKLINNNNLKIKQREDKNEQRTENKYMHSRLLRDK
jgi:hypothetical protein